MSDRRLGLQAQLLAMAGTLTVLVAVVVAALGRYGARVEFTRLQDAERRDVAERGHGLTPGIAARLDGRCCRPADLDTVSPLLGSDLGLLVFDLDTGALRATAGTALSSLGRLQAARHGDEVALEADRMDRDGPAERLSLRYLQPGSRIRLADGSTAELVVVPVPSAQRARALSVTLGGFDRRLMMATASVGLVAVALAWGIARRTVRPIAELHEATAALASGRLSGRVSPTGAREVADLARAFNQMADGLETQQALRRALVTDVAHELRTPLTMARCHLEMVADALAPDPEAAVRAARDEITHLSRLVDDLQDLALAEARELRLDVGVVDVAACIASGIIAAGLGGDSRVHVDDTQGLAVRADPVRVRQVVVNLLTNAKRYTPPSGAIRVSSSRERDAVRIEVTNTGSRLEPHELTQVFDRFYRTDPSRQRITGGTGLGLAIVKHLVEAQGGRVWAHSGPDEVAVGFSLPAAEADLSSA